MTPIIRRILLIAAVGSPLAMAATNQTGTATTGSDIGAYPNFTYQRRLAMMTARQAHVHPKWSSLSPSARVARFMMFARRILKAAAATPGTGVAPSSANFQGNLTAINGPSGDAIALQRMDDCSLAYKYGTYTLSFTSPAIQVASTTGDYQDVLHAAAGLTTTGDAFADGCSESTLGIGSRRGFYLGKTSQNLYMFASYGYDYMADSNALYYGTIDPTTQTVHSFDIDLSQPNIGALAAGDLNGDGLADIVGLDEASGSIMVWIANADGSIGTPTRYTLPGDSTHAAVMDDFNGDGKVDVVVSTTTSSGQEQISVLTGNGDGTLNAAQSFPVTTPSNLGPQPVQNLVAVDLRGTGHPDIVGSNGLVLLNNGDGTFTEGSPAFPPFAATSSWGPNLAAGDFNRDGKADVAVDDGLTIRIYLGNGDGTFTAGKRYMSNDSVGYLTATDLDGDGNLDLYVGLANGGFFGGDQFGVGQAYALMGNGDGSFQGAPALPFVYTGKNMADLNGDGALDAVGVNGDLSFTSYLGDGHGAFTAHSTLSTSPITLGGQQLTLNGIDSYAIADINGDGKPDLAYIAQDFNGPGPDGDGPGIFIALGDGHGGFAAPSFYRVPSFLPAGDIESGTSISNLRLADVNKDGKADLIYSYEDTDYNTNIYYLGTAVQLSNGDGTFKSPQLIPFHSGPATTGFDQTSKVQQIADLNKDGNPDLIFVTETSDFDSTLGAYKANIQVAMGRGDGTFSAPTTVAGPDIMEQSFSDATPDAIKVADMNADGTPDIVALGASSSNTVQIAVSLGNGDGSFKAPILKTYSGEYLGNDQNIGVGDFNGDGKPDVVMVDPYDVSESGIYLGNGDGTLHSASLGGSVVPNLAINLPVGGATVALDLNGDGKQDVISGTTELLSQAASSTTPTQKDFSVGLSSSAGTVTPGQSVQTTITLTPDNGFSGTVNLSCSGLPTGATCSFAPPSVNVNGAAATTTLTIATTATAVAANSGRPLDPSVPGGILLAAVGIPILVRRRNGGGLRLGMFALLMFSALALHGCGGGGGSGSGGGGSTQVGTPAGSYNVTITAASGSVTHNFTYSLTVN